MGPWGDRDGNAGIRVAPWGRPGGAGSVEDPLADLEEAILASLETGEPVLLGAAPGGAVYPANLHLAHYQSGTRLVGRCAQLVSLDGAGAERPTVYVTVGDFERADLTISGGTMGVLLASASTARLQLRDVVLRDNLLYGLVADGSGSTLELIRVSVLDTETLDEFQGNPMATTGFGLVARNGGQVVGEDLRFDGNRGFSVLASEAGSHVTFARATIGDTLNGEGVAHAVTVQAGATFDATDLAVEGRHTIGLFVRWAGQVTVTGARIVNPELPEGSYVEALGIVVLEQGQLQATGLDVGGLHRAAVWVANGTASVSDARIQPAAPGPELPSTLGIVAEAAATLVLSDMLIEGAHGTGLTLTGVGTTGDVSDLRIVDTQPVGPGLSGRGIVVQHGAALTARDVELDSNHDIGLFAGSAGTTVVLEGGRIAGTLREASGTSGRGIAAQEGAQVVISDVVLEDNRDGALFASDLGTVLQVTDVLVRGTLASDTAGGGVGVVSQMDAEIRAERLEVADSSGPGVFLSDGLFHCTDCRLVGNQFAGASLLRGRLELIGGTVSGSLATGSRGGGVGVFAWAVFGPPEVLLDGVVFEELPGPAVYLRGPGRYELRDPLFVEVGLTEGPFGYPPALVAVDGATSWQESDSGSSGLLLHGAVLRDVPGEGVLLDASSGTLEGVVFDQVGGVDLYTQHCDGVAPPEVGPDPVETNDCEGYPRVLEPLLWWAPDVGVLEPE